MAPPSDLPVRFGWDDTSQSLGFGSSAAGVGFLPSDALGFLGADAALEELLADEARARVRTGAGKARRRDSETGVGLGRLSQ